MTDDILFHRETTMVRRLRLAPGEAMPWHRDPFQRVAVILNGDVLSIEYRDGGESQRIEVAPGQVEWEEPIERVHRAVNVVSRPMSRSWCFCSTARTRWRSRPRNRLGILWADRITQDAVDFICDEFHKAHRIVFRLGCRRA